VSATSGLIFVSMLNSSCSVGIVVGTRTCCGKAGSVKPQPSVLISPRVRSLISFPAYGYEHAVPGDAGVELQRRHVA
jgi:hypothetical protein